MPTQAPPLHARCRCTIVAYLDGAGRGERVASRTRIPDDITYAEWKAMFGLSLKARMRGYDVIARPAWRAGDLFQKVGEWLSVFEGLNREIYRCKGSTPAEIEQFITDKMNAWGKGSRAFVWFEWEAPIYHGGHVIVVQLNENGFVQYGDPQTGKIGVVRYFNEIKLDSVMIMRVDNLKFTNKIKWYYTNRK